MNYKAIFFKTNQVFYLKLIVGIIGPFSYPSLSYFFQLLDLSDDISGETVYFLIE